MTATLYMIGNAHIDPVWLWQWQEGLQEVKATFRSVLDRMNEAPDFVFTGSSAAFYEWVEQNDPRMFDEIRARVAEGRWEIVGGWWIQPDCNLPSGESFVRQGLYGQRYFRTRFGRTARVGFNPDSFGHHAMLPQILAKSGMDRYVFMRPGPHEKTLPARLFFWESDDGSRVLAYRIPYEYCTGPGELEQHVRKCAGELKAPLDELMCFYGVGNHGGGPTRANLASIRRLDGLAGSPALPLATTERFFAATAGLRERLPVVHDELQHHAVGCYAAHSGVKRWNRRAENLLLAAERLGALAHRVAGAAYAPDDLHRAWKNVLFNQFHDILAGTSLEAAYDDARDAYGEAAAIAGRALNHAVQALAWNVAIAPEEAMRPVVVFNPHAFPSTRAVELEYGGLRDGDALIDDADAPVAFQTVRSGATVGAWRKRLCFVAELPAFGHRVYRVVRRPDAPPPALPPVAATATTAENARFRLEIDPATGGIASLFDRRHDWQVFAGVAARPVVAADPTDTWGHGTLRFQTEVGTFRATRVSLAEQGPVKAVLRAEAEFGASRLVQEYSLFADPALPIEVRVTVDWRERFQVLKLRFPTNLQFPRATYEIPYGHIERPTGGDEEPMQTWVDLSGVVRSSGEIFGLSVLNDGKYSADVLGSELGVTVLRSPIYAHHDPFVPSPDGAYPFMDQGPQTFTYALVPHAGSWERAGTVRRAAELNLGPVALIETYHPDGALPQRASYASTDRENVLITVLKRPEDGGDDALIVRCVEVDRVATRATITLAAWDRAVTADFGPCEIKTFRVPTDPARPVVELDLLEDPLPQTNQTEQP